MILRPLVSDPIEIPNEPGQWVRVRRLNRRRLTEAAIERSKVAFANIRALGGADFLSLQAQIAAVKSVNDGTSTDVALVDDVKKADDDPLTTFDADTLLKLDERGNGIAEWSYGDVISQDDIDGLDPETAAWLARTIYRFSVGKDDAVTEKKD